MEKIQALLKKYPLASILIALAFISCFAILNAAPIMSNVANPYWLWAKQLLFFGIGIVLLYVVYTIGMDVIYTHINIIYWILMGFLAGLAIDHIVYTKLLHIHIVPLASYINGSTCWYNLPFFSFQPSEFMKIVIIILLAKMTYEFNKNQLIRTTESEIRYIFEVLKITIPPCILILLENDTGVIMIIMAGVFFILLSSGLRKQWFIFIGVIIGVVLVLAVYLWIFHNGVITSLVSGHRLSRVYGWLDPEGTYKDQGLQLWYSVLSYGTSGWFGHGFQAVIKAFPEGQTDFIFAVIATNYGFVGAAITLAAVVALDVVILRIGLSSANDRDKYYAMGIFGLLIFQQVWNIGMVLGLFPITGITLPFVSYGGSSLLSYMIAMGFFFDIDYQNKLIDAKHKSY